VSGKVWGKVIDVGMWRLCVNWGQLSCVSVVLCNRVNVNQPVCVCASKWETKCVPTRG